MTSDDGWAEDGIYLCERCVSQAAPQEWQSCPKCGGCVPVAPGAADGCPLCKMDTFHFDTAVALGEYHTRLREFIFRMKRPQGELLARSLGRLLFRQNRQRLGEFNPDAVVPVPMHWLRRFGRGVNNPEHFGISLSKELGIPLCRGVLRRIRNTPPQSGLLPKDRVKNVRGAFRVRRGHRLQGRRILLVDDVLTTGATCSEAARVLKEAGAGFVAVAVVARAQGEFGRYS
jgi:ComF family protein